MVFLFIGNLILKKPGIKESYFYAWNVFGGIFKI
tara:strand:- start:1014 stop:1115 length:102 start_codon:yes stop_codon:yes gene_type:complete